MKTQLSLDGKNLHLHCYPIRKNEKHQAWDAADEYLIEQLALVSNAHILIFNDKFGALCCYAAEKKFRITVVNDSYVAQQSIKQNLHANFPDQNIDIQFISSLDPLPEDIDLAIMKLPKNHRFLIWQLSQLAALKKPKLTLIAADKAKNIQSATLALFEKHLGKTKTSLAKKKARLIFCEKNQQLETMPYAMTEFSLPEYQLRLQHFANVFSAQKLDPAAFLMLAHIPSSQAYKDIIDLGCGNGVLAIQAARQNPQASITVFDESYMAVASAKINLLENGVAHEKIKAQVNNCLHGVAEQSADLILCNPPFHQERTLTDHIAWQMFCDAKRVLRPQGRLIVIGNRHLGYHTKLKRLFANITVIGANAKFTVIEVIK